MSEMLQCHFCPPDDNLWPADAFRGAGNSYDGLGEGTKRMCTACHDQRYPPVKRRCTQCLRIMNTRGSSPAPTCLPCRQGTPARAFWCLECGVDARRRKISRRTSLCHACRTIDTYRARTVSLYRLLPPWEVGECELCHHPMRYRHGWHRTRHRECARRALLLAGTGGAP